MSLYSYINIDSHSGFRLLCNCAGCLVNVFIIIIIIMNILIIAIYYWHFLYCFCCFFIWRSVCLTLIPPCLSLSIRGTVRYRVHIRYNVIYFSYWVSATRLCHHNSDIFALCVEKKNQQIIVNSIIIADVDCVVGFIYIWMNLGRLSRISVDDNKMKCQQWIICTSMCNVYICNINILHIYSYRRTSIPSRSIQCLLQQSSQLFKYIYTECAFQFIIRHNYKYNNL